MTTIAILLGRPVASGQLEISDGKLSKLTAFLGAEAGDSFSFVSAERSARLVADVEGAGSIVRLTADGSTFSVRAKDILGSDWPVIIEDMAIALTTADDSRTYAELRHSVAARLRGGITALDRINAEEEESFEAAAVATRALKGPIWLGLSRDMRLFSMSLRGVGAEEPRELRWDWIQPLSHAEPLVIEESDAEPVRYQFLVGRGLAATEDITRRLIDGSSPVLAARIVEGDVLYEVTAFAGLEAGELDKSAVSGTHFLVADGHARGHMFTESQQAEYDRLVATADADAGQPVHFTRVTATNRGSVPRYAYLKIPFPDTGVRHARPVPCDHDGATGFSRYAADRVFCVALQDGRPLERSEVAVLLAPGTTTSFEFRLPHRPVTETRAQRLAERRFDDVLAGCLRYWQAKQADAAQFRLPERRIDEMVRAGINHLDLILLGAEPEGPLCPTVGLYSAIGSESSPIIQFLDSAGLHGLAERSLDYFLEKQHEDGFIQNFFGYMLETEAVLWSLGEHFRYTRDERWAARILPKLKQACGYVLGKRRDQLAASRSGGYGLLVGKTADPEDPYESFMLNGYAYLGLSRAAEILRHMGDGEWEGVEAEAERLKADIRRAFRECLEASPVVPLGDGTWRRTAPPWTGARGPLCLDPIVKSFYSHGAVTTRDSLLGPLWLAVQEVLDPDEEAVDWLLDYHAELFHDRNVALTQPYYSPHPRIHLLRGETKRFLKAYYNSFASLADRETYSFWEHYYQVSPHKTHEEAWFLMQTRWMLYMEKENELCLFRGIPRKWLHPGARIEIGRAASYFGPFEVTVDVSQDGGSMRVRYEGDPTRGAQRVSMRLPHPDWRLARRVGAGTYDPATETVMCEGSSLQFEVVF